MSGRIADLEMGGIVFSTFPPEAKDPVIKDKKNKSETKLGKLLRQLELSGKFPPRLRKRTEVLQPS